MIFKKIKLAPLLVGLVMFPLSQYSRAADGQLKQSGNVLAIGLPIVAAGISVLQDDASGLYQLAKSEGLTIVSSELLKRSVHETRPNGQDDRSFPSRHTAVAFAAAQYMQMRGGWEYGLPAYAAAMFVGFSRVQTREHHWRDVAAGAGLGMLASYYFTDSSERNRFSFSALPKGAYAEFSAAW